MIHSRFVRFLVAGTFWLIVEAVLPAQSSAAEKTFTPAASAAAKKFDKLVKTRRYVELQRQLPGANLTAGDRAYFEGVIADRTHHVSQAITLLEKVLPELKATNSFRAATALHSLAGDYFESGRYADAADAYTELLKRYRSRFTPAETQSFSDNLHTYELLRGASPQQVGGSGTFSVPVRRNPIGVLDVPVKVGNAEMWWIFDTGANITTISLSTAKHLGLTLSKGQASTQSGATGREVPLWTTVIPELTFGGAAVRNVAALVSEDKALDIDLGKERHFAIPGILGYPVLAALGSFTFSEQQLTVGSESVPASMCTQMFVEELTPLIVARVDSRELLFGFDTGAGTATLTAKYLHAFSRQFASLKPTRIGAAGAGGARVMPGYRLPSVTIHVGGAAITLHDVSVLMQPTGDALLDSLYGNLGQGLIAPLRSYTIDFSHMQLCVSDGQK